ncbi:cytochrome P450 26A1-like [Mercenaria mercenaria]|uniref:cytochrome P450 26A1-like n=1 Tax=Mercenaria mercenaria TaxID=6596 RepID=UPI00234ECD2C|nr:cytochrome P450 26A1-like [Mercenaria mercenaria]XP_053406787.1 cytochrome P450 26A1-like [Mercenaria mercenaria]XP_053406788.1 cytochrome P450 26A1-like [Mercenaria mercenaria]XP_053406789.1 cytochrome P450 26A1-like [Mercenaria mercenaria]
MELIETGFGYSDICWLACGLIAGCTALLPPVYIILHLVRLVWEYYVTSCLNIEGCQGLSLPPGTMGYPFVGESVEFLRKRCTFYQEKVEKYGCIYKTHLLGRPTIRVIGAENVKKILMGENSLVTSNWPKSARILLGAGSVSQSAGIVHRVRRKHMLRAFSLETLNSMVPVVQEVICKSLMDWRNRKEVYTYPECKLMAFTVSACALIGLDMTSSKKSGMHDTFMDVLKNIMTLPFNIPGFGFRKGMRAKRQLLNTLRDLLPETEKHPYTTILKAYYDSCQKLGTDSEDEIYEGVLDLLFAGHETVTSAVTSCVMFLGQNENVLEKLRRELAEYNLLEGNNRSDLNFKVINDLKYLKNVVKEVIRLCPPVGAGFRKALKSFELGGYLIPKDWTVMFSIRETQQLSPVFEHSEKFDPDRWDKILSTRNSSPEGFNYIPFGFGARGCVGKMYAQLVIKIFVIELVRSCDWCLKNKNIEMTYIPIPVARDHLPVIFCARGEFTANKSSTDTQWKLE